jgi:hypothetical protein
MYESVADDRERAGFVQVDEWWLSIAAEWLTHFTCVTPD